MPQNQKSYKAHKEYFKKPTLSDYTHNRTVTAYKYFDLQGKVRAGPHTSSHVFTQVNVERLAQNKTIDDYRVLLGTRLVPSPGKANAILKEGLGRKDRLASTEVERRKFLSQYTRLYNKFATTASPKAQWKLLAKIIELSPQQTYRWAEGFYTPKQIAGKGESGKQAEIDSATLKKFSADLNYAKISELGAVSALERWKQESSFKSIDYDAGSQSPDDLRRVVRRSSQLVRVAGANGHDWETLSDVSHVSDHDFLTKTGSGLYSVKRLPGSAK